jgi:hypothetical protein
LFTRRSRKLRLVAATLLGAAVIALTAFVSLDRLAAWAERNGAYPYEAGEDPMRLLLRPLVEGHRRADIMVTGPSSSAEAFLVDELAAAFPDKRILALAFSTATLDDTLVQTEYIERVYGREFAPRALVVGIGVRFIANIPRHFGERRDARRDAPLLEIISRYSPHFRVQDTPDGSTLVPKTAMEALAARLQFLRKQQPRYRAAAIQLVRRFAGADPVGMGHPETFPRMRNVREPLSARDLPVTVERMRRVGFMTFLREWTPLYATPYLTHVMPRATDDSVRARVQELWTLTEPRAWDPGAEAALVRRQLGELAERCRHLGTTLYLVNLPEHPRNRALYPAGRLDAYLDVVRAALPDVPLLDLVDLLPSSMFNDPSHVTYAGARAVTARTISFLRAVPDAAPPTVADAAPAAGGVRP